MLPGDVTGPLRLLWSPAALPPAPQVVLQALLTLPPQPFPPWEAQLSPGIQGPLQANVGHVLSLAQALPLDSSLRLCTKLAFPVG